VYKQGAGGSEVTIRAVRRRLGKCHNGSIFLLCNAITFSINSGLTLTVATTLIAILAFILVRIIFDISFLKLTGALSILTVSWCHFHASTVLMF